VYALLLFGGELKVDHEKGRLTMDGWAEFNAPAGAYTRSHLSST